MDKKILEPKRILVAGGAGFIGAHLCRKLLELGHQVTVLDNLYTGKRANIQELETNPNFRFISGDVRQPQNLEVDQIYNLACPASPPHYQKDPLFTLTTSIEGTLRLLELAEKSNAVLLQASTSEIYGDPAESPQKESYWGNVNPVGLRSCYDEGKRAAETLCMDFYRGKKAVVKIARIFNTYGPFMDQADGRAVSNFITQALDGRPLTVYGKGEQTRSFQYVSDLVTGLIALMYSTADFIGPVNLGNPEELTILELADEILKQIPSSKSKKIFQDLPGDDPKRRRPDITLAKTALNWQPVTGLTEGLEKTINYFKSL